MVVRAQVGHDLCFDWSGWVGWEQNNVITMGRQVWVEGGRQVVGWWVGWVGWVGGWVIGFGVWVGRRVCGVSEK